MEKKKSEEPKAPVADEKDKEIAHLAKDNEELTNALKRLQADWENFRKRNDKEVFEYRNYAIAELVGKLLPILDSFALALKNTANKEDFVKGVGLIYSQLYDLLEKEGLKPISAEGKFDPYLHEVLLTEKTEKDEDDEKIVQELQRGYLLKGKIVRFAKVKILKR